MRGALQPIGGQQTRAGFTVLSKLNLRFHAYIAVTVHIAKLVSIEGFSTSILCCQLCVLHSAGLSQSSTKEIIAIHLYYYVNIYAHNINVPKEFHPVLAVGVKSNPV